MGYIPFRPKGKVEKCDLANGTRAEKKEGGKGKLEAFGVEGQRSGHACLIATCSVSGQSVPKGVSKRMLLKETLACPQKRDRSITSQTM